MKILHINVNPHYVGGGLLNHVIRLAEEQAKAGHDVGYLSSGRYDPFFVPYLKTRRTEGIAGMTFFELANSPNRPLKQRGRPLNQISDLRIERLFSKAIDSFRPEVVHIHDLQGLCATVIDIAKAKGIPVLFTFHNYWALCSEVELFDYTGKNCHDFEGGARCVPCNWSDRFYYTKLALSTTLESIMGRRLYSSLKRILPAKDCHDHPSGKNSDMTLKIGRQYAERRRAFVERINRCDGLIAISTKVKEIYASFGADKGRIKVINNPLFMDDETITRLGTLAKRPKIDTEGKVRFCFRGSIIKGKGIETLLAAFSKIGSGKAELYIWGKGESDFMDQLKTAAGSNVFFMGSYEMPQLPSILNDIDVGIIPSLWEEAFCSVGLEFLAAGIPVIASRIGGITDYISDGSNGLLFAAGDAGALMGLMNRFIENPSLIKKLKDNTKINIRRPSNLCREMDSVYREVLETAKKGTVQ